jgi:DNA-binding NarL/FixJ family response regulator
MLQVLIISNQHLFSNGLASLLKMKANSHIIAHPASPQHVINVVQRLQADVVVVDDTYSPHNYGAAVMPILQLNPNLLVLGLNLHSNTLQIYQCQQHTIKTTADLVDVLQALSLVGLEEKISSP